MKRHFDCSAFYFGFWVNIYILNQYVFAVPIRTDAPVHALMCACSNSLACHRAKEQFFFPTILCFFFFFFCFPLSKYVRKLTFFAFIIRVWRELNSIFVVVSFFFFSFSFFFIFFFAFCLIMVFQMVIKRVWRVSVCKWVSEWVSERAIRIRIC